MGITLSDEQTGFLGKALSGKNILVDACIGSGKTTTIQALCNALKKKSILYLTYNRLLKLDAKDKIKNKNVTVQNYHGFAYSQLVAKGIKCGVGELIRTYNRVKPPCRKKYDVLILDEYQDIDEDISKMLYQLKALFPDMQLIAVGDMAQKIYDYTSLDVEAFINDFLGDFERMTFTRCFRLSEVYAAAIGQAWGKQIIGVNPDCEIEIRDEEYIYEFLKTREPKEILCLGARTGKMVNMLNRLESDMPEKFNKYTIYASISDTDRGRVDPNSSVGIFTTFDSAKGLERDVCVVFDYDYAYWSTRSSKPNVRYEILRNIFLVAASRGKRKVIFCGNETSLLPFSEVATPFKEGHDFTKPFNISTMFDYKFREDIDATFENLDIVEIPTGDNSEIKVKPVDGLIDMAPCIGLFTEACYFNKYSIDDTISFQWQVDKKMKYDEDVEQLSSEDLMGKIRYSTYLSTKQRRYFTQSRRIFVNEEEEALIKGRLSSVLPADCETQRYCEMTCGYQDDEGEDQVLTIVGMTDEIYEGMIYELKFSGELSHEHFLQLASYMAALNVPVGRLWNVRFNKMYEVRIKDRNKFLNDVVKTITKGYIQYFEPAEKKRDIATASFANSHRYEVDDE